MCLRRSNNLTDVRDVQMDLHTIRPRLQDSMPELTGRIGPTRPDYGFHGQRVLTTNPAAHLRRGTSSWDQDIAQMCPR